MTIEDAADHLDDVQRRRLNRQVRDRLATLGEELLALSKEPPYTTSCGHCFYRVLASELMQLTGIYLAAGLQPEESIEPFVELMTRHVEGLRHSLALERELAAREAEAAKLKVH